ncbi:hypothetical protein [Terriglobus sp.]|uniref:hypothetical protein n=1 Tax=Terriglobus sp. TaxID=1889013 RepID=UPI003AFFADFE
MMLIDLCFLFSFGCWIALADAHRKFKQEQGRRIHYELCTLNLLRASLGTEPYFACPECAAVSYSLGDIEQGYCGRCQRETRKPYQMEAI